MWDTVKENYTEAISAAFPIHRFLIAVLGFLCAIAIAHQSHLSVIETLLRFQLSSLSTESGKLFEHASLMDCLWGLLLCGSSFSCYQLLAKTIFSSISKIVNYRHKVEVKFKQFQWLSELPSIDRSNALKRVDLEKKSQQKLLKSRAVGAELLIAIFLALTISSYWGNTLDIIVAALAFFVAVGLQANLVYLFFAKYLGPALQESILNGEKDEIRPPS